MYITVTNLVKNIRGKQILKDISVSLEKGKIYGFVGDNGSGKTMFFRALSGFIRVSSGKIEINGKSVNFDKDYPEKLGIILETPGFINNVSGLENLKYLAQINDSYNEEKVEELLKLFGLYDVKDKKVKSYSLGMKQKLGIIQAIMENQELIILDEPTNGLDKKSVSIFIGLMLRLKKEGKTILIASHNDYEIKELADKIFIVDAGVLSTDVGQ